MTAFKKPCGFFFLMLLLSCQSGAQSKKTKTLEINDEVFSVELAVSDEEWRKGLMFRKHLAEREGMLFVGNQMREQSFWMKNTLIPLDIIFIDEALKIVHIARETTPHSEDPIPSGRPAMHILEIRGGGAEALGVKVGDELKLNFELPKKEAQD